MRFRTPDTCRTCAANVLLHRLPTAAQAKRSALIFNERRRNESFPLSRGRGSDGEPGEFRRSRLSVPHLRTYRLRSVSVRALRFREAAFLVTPQR